VIIRLQQLVSQYRKVSKVQIKATSQGGVYKNQKLQYKLLKIDEKCKTSFETNSKFKEVLERENIMIRTFQDARIGKDPQIMDGLGYHLFFFIKRQVYKDYGCLLFFLLVRSCW
jgi:hypothetical protein